MCFEAEAEGSVGGCSDVCFRVRVHERCKYAVISHKLVLSDWLLNEIDYDYDYDFDMTDYDFMVKMAEK